MGASAAAAAAIFAACVGDDPATTVSSAADSGADTGTAETGTGPVDAAVANDAGVNSTCKTMFPNADFCDDFDNGIKPVWSQVKTNGQLAVVTSPHVSAPNALSALTTVPTTSSNANATLTATIATAGATEFTLDVRVQQLASSVRNVNSSPIAIQLTVGTVAKVVLQPRTELGTVACVTTGAQLGGFGNDLPFAVGAWHHVVLKAVAAGGGSVNVSCDVDGTTLSATVTDSILADATALVGLVAFDGQGPLSLLYDDVVFDAK